MTDKKIEEYLERAGKIRGVNLNSDYPTNRILIAQMIQLEEHREQK